MIDLHCHILPGLDDGPIDLQQSLKMAQIAVKDSITTIAATPHVQDLSQSIEGIETTVAYLNNELQNEGIPLTIVGGGEFSMMLNPEYISGYSINGSKYILVEFPHTHLPRSAAEDLFNIQTMGYIPIIAHPERNPSVMENPDCLLELLDSNVLVQLTAASLCGTFGTQIRNCSRYLLKKGAVDILASDAHDAEYRKPVLSKALKLASKLIGKEKAKMLVYDTPKMIIESKKLNGKRVNHKTINNGTIYNELPELSEVHNGESTLVLLGESGIQVYDT